jgi:hypothetical protein
VLEISGLKYLFRGAYPCSFDRFRGKLISEKDLLELQRIAEKDEDPDLELLERCFPNAMAGYRKSCEESHCEVDFSFESVDNYWRNYHGHTGECAVRMAVVCGIYPERMVKVICGKETFSVSNTFNIDLNSALSVLVHRRTIIGVDF